ncbi:unnamed protein product [Tuber aestivum]|uniref:Uncharacterized protein n=1 Tax=Tuber aestivum TaxID=59557 RepID=A0A292Q951_9PEZI|nr:unnamed protein product [Tuber aestivum]
MEPTKTYKVHGHLKPQKRMVYRFTTPDQTDPIERYFILDPPGYKMDFHHKGWRAIVHSGPNPKKHTLAESPIVGRITRSMCWKKIQLEMGGSIQREVKTDEKAIKVKSLQRCNKLRKVFCMRPKPLAWTAEDESALQGIGEAGGEKETVVMVHTGHRKYEFEVAGVKYRWTGTKLHSSRLVKGIGLKGFAYSLKLVRLEDKRLIASYQKKYGVCSSLRGYLHFYTDEKSEILPETVIVHSAYGMIRSEKAKRDTTVDILQQMAEEGGG